MHLCNLGNHLILVTTMNIQTKTILKGILYLIKKQKLTEREIANLIKLQLTEK